MSNPFEPDMLRNLLGMETPPKTANPKVEPEVKPLPAIRGKRIDGVLYVRAADVADALASQAPKANERLIAKLRGAS